MMTTARSSRGKYQKRGSGLRSSVHLQNQVGEQALLLVGLRNRDLGEVDPVGEEQIVGADRRRAVAFLSGPGRVALTRVDDRARQIVGECRRLAAVAADAAQRDGRIGGRRRRARVQRRQLGRAAERVAVGGAVELNGLGDDSGSGTRSGDQQIGVAERRPGGRSGPSRLASCASGRIAIRFPPPVTQLLSIVTCAAVSGISPRMTTS